MTDFPTIRIKCDEKFRDKALLMAESGLRMKAGETAAHTMQTFRKTRDGREQIRFYVERTKTGVSVRQIIDGRAKT